MASRNAEKLIRDLFEQAEIHINGSNPWDIQVHNPDFYDRLLQDPYLALGEGYMDAWWDCESIDGLIDRGLRAHLDQKLSGDWRIQMNILLARISNLQSSARAYQVGEQHYDLGNDLYQAMLDQRLNYTCAYWKDSDNLDDAQEAKLDIVCRKIGLKPGMSVLELGCGWGSFAKFAAERYGVSVLGLTVSKEQAQLGMELCRGLPVELRLQDYRLAQGQYDAVISIGIMEHVGYKNYRSYMQVASRCLKEGGIAFIHTIGGNITVFSGNSWTHKYIFPNGMLPSIAQLGSAMEGLFVMEDWHNIGPDYDKTLMAWHSNFERAWPELKRKYDQRFYRMWRYYLLSSAGGFRSRDTNLWQIVMTRPGTAQPDCRMV